MEKRPGLKERAAEALDLPADAVAGVPRIELIGDRRLRVENHRGILAYGETEIHIGGGRMAIRVVGTGLALRVMNRAELLITGQIVSVTLE